MDFRADQAAEAPGVAEAAVGKQSKKQYVMNKKQRSI